MSTIATYFMQRCPVCSRPLQVPVELLGQTVACQQCSASFIARDSCSEGDPSIALARRVSALLADCSVIRSLDTGDF